MDKQYILSKLQNYTYNSNRLAEVNRDIASMSYKTTPTYGNLAGGMCGGNTSKVEKHSIKSYELHKKKAKYEKEVKEVVKLIEHSGLDEREKELMWWLAGNGKLQAYARRERIGKFNIYKIRDRAFKKIIATHKPQKRV